MSQFDGFPIIESQDASIHLNGLFVELQQASNIHEFSRVYNLMRDFSLIVSTDFSNTIAKLIFSQVEERLAPVQSDLEALPWLAIKASALFSFTNNEYYLEESLRDIGFVLERLTQFSHYEGEFAEVNTAIAYLTKYLREIGEIAVFEKYEGCINLLRKIYFTIQEKDLFNISIDPEIFELKARYVLREDSSGKPIEIDDLIREANDLRRDISRIEYDRFRLEFLRLALFDENLYGTNLNKLEAWLYDDAYLDLSNLLKDVIVDTGENPEVLSMLTSYVRSGLIADAPSTVAPAIVNMLSILSNPVEPALFVKNYILLLSALDKGLESITQATRDTILYETTSYMYAMFASGNISYSDLARILDEIDRLKDQFDRIKLEQAITVFKKVTQSAFDRQLNVQTAYADAAAILKSSAETDLEVSSILVNLYKTTRQSDIASIWVELFYENNIHEKYFQISADLIGILKMSWAWGDFKTARIILDHISNKNPATLPQYLHRMME